MFALFFLWQIAILLSMQEYSLWARVGSAAGSITLSFVAAASVLFGFPGLSIGQGVASATTTPSSFLFTFNSDGLLQEAGSMLESTSPYFWLNSGGQLVIHNGMGSTIAGKLPTTALWRLRYLIGNALDTGNGYYPQNLFRLVTKSAWKNVDEQVRVRIDAVNLTDTPNRDEWSGILLMSRYQDGDTLYYAGVREDGTAVIKKKYQGIYYTLAQAPVFVSAKPYNRTTNPNLIPAGKWFGLRSTTEDLPGGGVRVRLFLDENNTGVWRQVLSADDGAAGTRTTAPISLAGYAGIRTDYLDVSFDDYKISTIPQSTATSTATK